MYRNELLFPALVYVGEGLPDGDGNPRLLNKLDWSKKDALRPSPELPVMWEDYLNEQVYSLSTDYAAEIRRTVSMGIMERSIYRSFDTCVRDFCLAPSDAYFEVAFRLLADCAVDPETLRPPTDQKRPVKYLLPNMMLYRFWQFQTGCGLPWFKSHMDGIVEPNVCREVPAVNQQFYNDMKVHDRQIVDGHLGRASKVKMR